MTLNCTL